MLTRQSGEIAKFHELRLKRIVFRQVMQRRVQGQEVEVWLGCDQAVGVRASTLPAAAVLATLLAAGVVNQDAAHGLGGGGKEMPAVVPVRVGLPGLTSGARHETQVGLVNQGRGLECLTRPLLGQLLRRQLAQLVIDQGQKLVGGVRVALFDGGQDACDVAHGPRITAE